MKTNWAPVLQSAFEQRLAVAISEHKQSGRQAWETHHAACRIVAVTPTHVTLDDHTRIALVDITAVTIRAGQDGVSPFVGRVGHLRYTIPTTFPVKVGAQ